jgi:hypothetical protein
MPSKFLCENLRKEYTHSYTGLPFNSTIETEHEKQQTEKTIRHYQLNKLTFTYITISRLQGIHHLKLLHQKRKRTIINSLSL